MAGLLNIELEEMWKEAPVTYFEAGLVQTLGLEKLKRTRQAHLLWSTSDPRFEPGNSYMPNRNANHPAATVGMVDTSFLANS
jgi:hypothetical protein